MYTVLPKIPGKVVKSHRDRPRRPGPGWETARSVAGHYARRVPMLRLFAAARDAAGVGRDQVPGATVGDVLQAARGRYGEAFAAVLDASKVWVNGEPAVPEQAVVEADEVAVLPPVSGGSGAVAPARAPGARRP